MLKINEIFFSIQGESTLVGYPTVFIRTSGCHLRCTYCDTTYAYYDGKKLSFDDIISEVQKYSSAKHVCLTGGEPLLQPESLELLRRLCDLNYTVSLETSGDLACSDVDPRVRKVIDVKTPDSGEPDSFDFENLKLKDVNSEFKFVICSEKDFLWSEEFIKTHSLERSNVLYSPCFDKISPLWLAEKILSEKSTARLQLQLHKYIWSPSSRGV
jgi:7-carboxy-7-deazaguanine synthase